MYNTTRTRPEHDSIDALLALQLLEEQEQSDEQEFFRITGEIRQFGLHGPELETELPNLLKTRRERSLYAALMTLIKSSRHHRVTHLDQHRDAGSVEREFRGLF